MKPEVVKRVMEPTLIYSSETWTLTKRRGSRLHIVMRFLRKMGNERLAERVFEAKEVGKKRGEDL